MNILPFTSPVTPLTEVTLDALWREATSLGCIRVWQYEHTSSYSVSIKWKRKSGSEIEAKGEHSDICVAISRAIDEARDLGAGPTC